jgi:penicillin-binding protein 2
MTPRRNPDIVVAVLSEHGGWGAEAAAPLAAQVINAFVTKQRKRDGNIHIPETPQSQQPKPALLQTGQPKPTKGPLLHPPTGE